MNPEGNEKVEVAIPREDRLILPPITQRQPSFTYLLNATIQGEEDYLDFCCEPNERTGDSVFPPTLFKNIRKILQAQGSYETVVEATRKIQRAMVKVIRALQQDTTITTAERYRLRRYLSYLKKWELRAEREIPYEVTYEPRPRVVKIDHQTPGKYTGLYRAVKSFWACVTDEKRVKRLKRCAREQCGQWFYDTTKNTRGRYCSDACKRQVIEHAEKRRARKTGWERQYRWLKRKHVQLVERKTKEKRLVLKCQVCQQQWTTQPPSIKSTRKRWQGEMWWRCPNGCNRQG